MPTKTTEAWTACPMFLCDRLTRCEYTPCRSRREPIECLKAFVAETVDYMTRNKLGDPERQHNVRWARSIIAKTEGGQTHD